LKNITSVFLEAVKALPRTSMLTRAKAHIINAIGPAYMEVITPSPSNTESPSRPLITNSRLPRYWWLCVPQRRYCHGEDWAHRWIWYVGNTAL